MEERDRFLERRACRRLLARAPTNLPGDKQRSREVEWEPDRPVEIDRLFDGGTCLVGMPGCREETSASSKGIRERTSPPARPRSALEPVED
jgi:hypothetical protein